MGWQDTVQPIQANPSPTPSGSWKDSIAPIADDGSGPNNLTEHPFGTFKTDLSDDANYMHQLVHGATGGLDDEAQGAIQALGEKGLEATGLKEDSGKSLHDMYREYQQAAEKDYKSTHDKDPTSTMTEMAGAALPMVVTMGMGGPAAETSAIQKIIQGMKTGAGYGAVAGVGGSEHNLDTVQGAEGLGEDTLQSAALGAGLGGGTAALGQGVKAAGGALLDKALESNNPFARQTAKAFTEGTKNLGFGGDANRSRVLQGTQDTASGITQDLGQGFKNINSQYGKVLEAHEAPIQLSSDASKSVSDVADALQSGDVNLPKSKSEDISSRLKQLMNGEMSATDAKQLQIDLRNLGSKVEGPMQSAFSDAASAVDEGLSDVPGYSDINSQFKQGKTIPESVISKAPGEVNQTYMSDMSKPDQNTYQGFKQVIQGGQTAGSAARPAKEALLNLKSTLDSIDPATLKTMGIDPTTIMSKIQNQGDLDAIMQAVQGHNPHGGIVSQVLGGHSLKGGAYRMANLAGQTYGAVAGPMVDSSHSLVTASPEALSGVASKLSENPTTAHLGAALSSSLDSKSEPMKNAALFSIMQNPNARKQVFGDNDNNDTGNQ